jgi:hypothetical protein
MFLKLLSILFVLSLLSNALFYALYKHERKAHFETMQTLTQCQSDLKTISQQLSEYAQKYESLKKLCELDNILYFKLNRNTQHIYNKSSKLLLYRCQNLNLKHHFQHYHEIGWLYWRKVIDKLKI